LTDDVRFWVVVAASAVIKAILSERIGWRGTGLTIAVAFFSAWIGTDPIMHFLQLEAVYRDAVIVVCALTGEALMRAIVMALGDPNFLKDIIEKRLGKK
jgi:hypothetical protein